VAPVVAGRDATGPSPACRIGGPLPGRLEKVSRASSSPWETPTPSWALIEKHLASGCGLSNRSPWARRNRGPDASSWSGCAKSLILSTVASSAARSRGPGGSGLAGYLVEPRMLHLRFGRPSDGMVGKPQRASSRSMNGQTSPWVVKPFGLDCVLSNPTG
jgi:hypothetical protein